MPNEKLIAFYSGKGTDDRGRRIDEIWRFSHEELESVHDYVQWLFPTRHESLYSPEAPVLTDVDIAAFRSDPLLRDAKKLAAREGTTLRALVEQGLRQVVSDAKHRSQPFRLRKVSFRGDGLNPEFAEAGWDRIRDLSYEGC